MGTIIAWMITYKELKYKEIIGLSQDNNQEWVSLLTIIYIVIVIVPFILIYQRELRDLKNILIDNIS